jgi:Zn-dependent metalloprotease
MTGYGQVVLLPGSPIDSTQPPVEPNPSAAQTAAAVETMFTMMEGSLGPQLGMKNPRQEWTLNSIALDSQARWHVKLNQAFDGIPVLDGYLSVHLKDGVAPGDPIALDDAVKSEAAGTSVPANRPVFHGAYLNDPEVDTNPVISTKEAMKIARKLLREQLNCDHKGKGDHKDKCDNHKDQHKADKGPKDQKADDAGLDHAFLEIHPGDGPGGRKLTFHTIVTDTSTNNPIQLHVWVGAQADNAGQVLQSYNNIQTAACTGNTLYQGRVSLNCAPAYGGYVLDDNSMRIGGFDMYQTTTSARHAFSGNTVFGNFSTGDRNTTNADTVWATIQTMGYFYYNHGRNYVDGNYGPKVYQSVDGLGPLLSARNHYGVRLNNAFWDSQWINIGDGDGSYSGPWATLDMVGHEWTHGVTQFVAGLVYQNESGALNESFSDIFGAMVERYWKGESSAFGTTWQIMEQAYTPYISGDALRYMYRPTLDGMSKDYYPSRLTNPNFDNGGVHFNSGIQNNAFWLLSTGQCHRFNGCMGFGIGADAAKRIFYIALRDYILSNDGFYSARYKTQYVAGILYGFSSNQFVATVRAWDLVGVPK